MANKQTRNAALRHGFRSGLEEKVADDLTNAGLTVHYESERIHYIKPARKARYTPDFPLPNGIVIETKGRFVVEDRQKHLIIKEQHPDIDIRFVFSNPNTKISKNSKTTYAAWCEKHGFQYSAKAIPAEWLTEPTCQKKLAAIKKAGEQ